MESLTKFGTTELTVKELKHGQRISVMGARAWKDAHGLKGADGRRQYNAYARTAGLAGCKDIGGRLAGGEILITSVKVNADKTAWDIHAVLPERFDDKTQPRQASITKVSDAELAAEIARRAASKNGKLTIDIGK